MYQAWQTISAGCFQNFRGDLRVHFALRQGSEHHHDGSNTITCRNSGLKTTPRLSLSHGRQRHRDGHTPAVRVRFRVSLAGSIISSHCQAESHSGWHPAAAAILRLKLVSSGYRDPRGMAC
eukprot:3384626-Rhodomonas_salina.1